MDNELKNLSFAGIAQYFREKYPDAVSVSFYVNYYDHDITISYKDILDGITMRTLNGEWVKEAANG